MQHHPQSHKRESRIRTGDGTVKSLPDDLHDALSEQKRLHGYETMWSAMVQSSRLGVRVMQAQADRAEEIIHQVSGVFDVGAARRAQL